MVSIPQGGGKGGSAPPQNSELCNSFKIWNWRVKKNIKILVLLFFSPSYVWIWRDKVILVRLLEVILKNPRSQICFEFIVQILPASIELQGGGCQNKFFAPRAYFAPPSNYFCIRPCFNIYFVFEHRVSPAATKHDSWVVIDVFFHNWFL